MSDFGVNDKLMGPLIETSVARSVVGRLSLGFSFIFWTVVHEPIFV